MLKAVTENLRFMVHEVSAQVEQVMQFFAEPSRILVEKISARDDYIDTLKSLIQDKSYSLLITNNITDKKIVHLLRSMNTLADNLERIGDFCVNMLRQSNHLSEIEFINQYDLQGFIEEVLVGLERIEAALEKRDIGLAFRICQCEFNLDEMYGAHFKMILNALRSGGDTGNLVTSLMILHYLERMGDSLLNIGEAIIFAIVGEKMKIQQYKGLTESLSASGLETPISEVEFESIWGTRSGCRIGVVGERTQDDAARPVLFKHGNHKKLVKEQENIEHWESLIPGLPPKVCGYVKGDDGDGSMLLEYLPGCTFQEIVINHEMPLITDALFIIEETVEHIWRTTRREETVRAGFVNQVRNRLDAVLRLHPQFQSNPASIGDMRVRSFGELLRDLDQVDRELNAPFSAFIHGDMNVNNIIYDSNTERLHFIDLHRSAQTDYVQDVSVFLISLFRLPIFRSDTRHKINQATMEFFEFAKNFAVRHDDVTFEARLALGLGRSFFTSTRFELNRKFAKKMYLLSVYLFEKLISHRDRPWPTFELPGEVLIY
jgi:phosphate uptake regulator